MAKRVFSDVAESTLASGILAGATSVPVAAGEGAEFPATGDFTVRIEDAADPDVFELVTATARSTDTLTTTPTANAWDAGDKVIQVVAKVDLDRFVQPEDGLDVFNNVDLTGIAAGSLLYYDGTNVVDLGIGTAGQVLKTNVGETAPEWKTGHLMLRRAAVQSIASSTLTDVSWDAEDRDTYGLVTVPQATITFTVATAGWKQVTAFAIATDTSVSGHRQIRVLHNSVEVCGARVGPTVATMVEQRLLAVRDINFAASDTLKVQLYQDSGGAMNFTGYLSVKDI